MNGGVFVPRGVPIRVRRSPHSLDVSPAAALCIRLALRDTFAALARITHDGS